MSFSKQASSVFKDLYKKAAKNIAGKMVGTGLLYNKWVLYSAFLVSIIYLLVWVVAGDIMNVVIFILIGFLTSFFSKNMVVILVFALVISNVLKFGLSIGQEGFEEGDENMEEETEHVKEAEGLTEGKKNRNSKKSASGTTGATSGSGTTGATNGSGETGATNGTTTANNQTVATDGEAESPAADILDNIIEDDNQGDNQDEGMQTLGYSSVVPTAMFEQQTLFSNLQKMSPLVINTDNESKIRAQLKYENFVAKR